ncbi:MAG: hypothetical protein MRY21_00810 [Simkaniaceae bacterium]|nr:hypothetical protein [Simkaniaceae bacterium]
MQLKKRPIILTNNGKRKRKNQDIPAEMIIGGIKILTGALCCIIPTPVTYAMGTGLVISGGNDIGKSLLEVDKKNKEIQKIHGPPSPPPRFARDFFHEDTES